MTPAPQLGIEPQPASAGSFAGLGVQSDAVLYNDANRQVGVTEADYALVESRLKRLAPGIARVFFPLTAFNPALDGHTYDWDTVEMQHQCRNLTVLREAGASVNLCMGPGTNAQMLLPERERWAVDALEHLVKTRGFDHIRWFSLFNEPDGFYDYDGLPEDTASGKPRRPWHEYVDKHRTVQSLLEQRALADTIRLEVADTVAPHRLRAARLRLARRDFGDLDVSYGFHRYTSDAPGYYDHPDSRPYLPPPMPEEMGVYRDAVGAGSELICWEFNNPGYGFGSLWPGVGAHGEAHTGSFAAAVGHSRMVLDMLCAGVDGVAHWCAGDMFYGNSLAHGLMSFGLWRFKWQQWIPRPVYFYYAALIEAFPPGCAIHRVTGLPESLSAAAARGADGAVTLALLNTASARGNADLPAQGEALRLRISPERLPVRADCPAHATPEMDLPLTDWQPLDPPRDGGTSHHLTLDPGELTLIRLKRQAPV